MSNIFSTLNPTRLFIKCALPNVISMAFISLYYVIDGIFIGRYLGHEALASFGLVLPFIMISFVIADTIAIGSSVQIAMKLGLKKNNEANQIFSSCLLIILGFSCVIGFLKYFLSPLILDFLDIDNTIKKQCLEVLKVFALFSPLTMLSFALDNYLRICAKTTYSMIINICIALSNIFFDYLFIVCFGWGLFSAALATCLGLTLGGILGILPFLYQNLTLKFVKFHISFKTFKNIIYNGSSEFFNNISASVFSIFANSLLLKISGVEAVAAFSIILYIDSFIISLLIAMCDAMQPALSFNWAKQDFKRVKSLLKPLFISMGFFSLLCFIFILFYKKDVITLFSKKNDLDFIMFTSSALIIFSLNYLITWINILISSFLTACNKPSLSLIISLGQNCFLPILWIFILSHFFGLNGIWIAPFIADFCIIFLALYFLKTSFKPKS